MCVGGLTGERQGRERNLVSRPKVRVPRSVPLHALVRKLSRNDERDSLKASQLVSQ